jgi:hypothetical protein
MLFTERLDLHAYSRQSLPLDYVHILRDVLSRIGLDDGP